MTLFTPGRGDVGRISTEKLQCKRRREHTNSSHTTKHAELSKAIALLKVTQSECKFNAARKSAASVFLRLQWVGVALSGVAGIMRIHNSMH